MLNDPWSIGYVSTLIELQPFAKKEDWEDFYYESGEKRKSEIMKLNRNMQDILEDESLVKNDKEFVKKMNSIYKNINTQHGRTKEDIIKKGNILYNDVQSNGSGITLDECIECVRFRIICETWNGIIVREHNTIENLKKKFPTYDFKKSTGQMDHQYAVDYEIYKNGKLSSAIQIKPESYTWNAPYINKAKGANKIKNQAYTNVFNALVYDIIADGRGNIKNPEILTTL
jgi:hypothetical protein